jgi:hypothetical protein
MEVADYIVLGITAFVLVGLVALIIGLIYRAIHGVESSNDAYDGVIRSDQEPAPQPEEVLPTEPATVIEPPVEEPVKKRKAPAKKKTPKKVVKKSVKSKGE